MSEHLIIVDDTAVVPLYTYECADADQAAKSEQILSLVESFATEALSFTTDTWAICMAKAVPTKASDSEMHFLSARQSETSAPRVGLSYSP